ncbi:XRE family transcriptional regulator [Candidatus Parcubacteria bacterium]|jgi:2'-deoxynucleoside 5'-phosphate N-hydrolase|nr:XRE family transcriptional regulator [Candidatus Parcubacteria bacterium]
MKVYISGALTGIPHVEELKKFYEEIAALCGLLGLEPYVPHLNSDPQAHASISPEEVYKMDSHQVKIADLVIAYIGMPSLGVGQELEISNYEDVPLIILYEGDKPVSRMAKGNPAVIKQVVFSSYEDALEQLRPALEEFVTSRA